MSTETEPRTPQRIEGDTRRAVAADIERLARGIIADPRTDAATAKTVAVILGMASAVALRGLS